MYLSNETGLYLPSSGKAVISNNQGVIRNNSYASTITQLGKGKDKAQQFEYEPKPRLTRGEILGIYKDDPLAAKIVDKIIQDALRKPYEIIDKDYRLKVNQFFKKNKKLNFSKHFKSGLRKGRLHGGGVTVLDIKDGQTQDKPVNFNKLKDAQIAGIFTVEKWYVQPENYLNPYLDPEQYRITVPGGQSVLWHSDRLLIWRGIEREEGNQQTNSSWDESVFQSVLQALKGFDVAHDSNLAVIVEYLQGIFKFENFTKLISSKNITDQQTILTKLSYLSSLRSRVNQLVIDKNDDFENRTLNVTGLNDLITQAERRLCAAADMPHTKLLGESPSGLGATGESEDGDWYDGVAYFQEEKFRPNLEKLLNIIGLILGIPEEIEFMFPSLWEIKPKVRADIELIIAQKDALYYDRDILTAEEIAKSRYEVGEFSTHTTLIETDRKNISNSKSLANKNKLTEDKQPDNNDLSNKDSQDNDIA